MRVKYNQTPPPVIDEKNGEVRVTKHLNQVSYRDHERGLLDIVTLTGEHGWHVYWGAGLCPDAKVSPH